MSARRITLLTLLLAALLTLAYSFLVSAETVDDGERIPVRFQTSTSEATVFASAAVSPGAQERGLADVSYLPENAGMLFIFADPSRPGFTMRGMRIPIDIIWLREGRVVDISPRLQPLSETEEERLYYPAQAADHALEVPAGWAARRGIVIGSRVRIG